MGVHGQFDASEKYKGYTVILRVQVQMNEHSTPTLQAHITRVNEQLRPSQVPLAAQRRIGSFSGSTRTG